MGGKTATTTQAVSIPPEVLARYRAVNARAEQVAEQPFQQYGGQFVAPVNPTQQAGIGATYQAAGAAQPYYGAAAGLTAAGAGPVSPGALETQRYMSPYTESVVDATRRGLEQQQGVQLAEQQAAAIRGGAFGGDRANIQRAVLQGQQGLTTAQAIAPLYQQAYGQAQQTAAQQQGVNLQAEQANAQRALAAGAQFGQLGSGAQQAGLAGAQALMGAGTLEQQTQQADLTARYQQFLQERGYPFQVAQFLANIAMGTGALSGSTTTTTQPAPFFSDEREKTNIKPLGKGLYAYDYIDDVERARETGSPMPPKRVGPMAQDIENKRPGLVVDINDYKVVNPSGDSMGGAVTGPGAYDRGGYAPGGLVGGDIGSILAAQQQFFGPYAGQGGPYGGQQQGKPGYVPAASLPVSQLKTAGNVPQQRPSGLAEAAQTGSQIAGLAKMGTDAFSAGKKWLESGKPEASVMSSSSKGADAVGGDYNIFDTVSGLFRASGGLVPRHGYAAGGSMNTAALPYQTEQDYFPEQILDTQKIEPLKPAEPPKQQSSGLGDIVNLGAKILPFFLASGGRAGYQAGGSPSFEDLIVAEAEKRNMPPALLRALIQQESGGRPTVVGSAGEVGLGQIKPSTARAPGYGVAPVDPRELTRPEVNIPFAADYLSKKAAHMGYKDLNDPENQRQALMLYNAGPQREKYAGEVIARMPGLGGAATERASAKPEGLGAGADRPAVSRVTPGLAGPGYVEDTPRTSPFKFFTEKALAGRDIGADTKSALTSENLWVPLLSGVGSMLASRSPYLASAVGEGLVGGTKAYTDLAKAQQETGESRARTENIVANMANTAFSEVGGILRVRVIDPRTGTYRMMSNAEYLALPPDRRPPIDPRVPSDVVQKFLGEGGTPAKAAVPGEPAMGAPAPGKVETRPLPPPETPKAEATTAPKTEATRPSGVPVSVGLDDADRREAFEEARKIANTSSATREDMRRRDMFGPQRIAATGAEQGKMKLLPLATTVLGLPENQSLGTSGPFTEAIAPYIATLQNLAEAATGKKGAVIDPQVLGDREKAKKLIAQLEAEATTQSGQTAVEAMKRISEGLINLSQSKTGQKQILANVLATTQRVIDKDRFFGDWISAGSTAPGGEAGTFADYARLSSEFAARKFDKKYSQSYYAEEEKKLLDMMNTRVKNPGDPAKPITVFEFVSKYGPQMDAEDLKAIQKKYGPGIMRYFGISG